MKPAIVVHGGAGAWKLKGDNLGTAITACEQAAAAGRAILSAGGSALDAVEAAARILEDEPVLDSGRGSYLNTLGVVELDALIMDGRTLAMGAVAAVQQVANPISLARQVMEQTEHTFLVGDGAGRFADSIGFPRCRPEDLVTAQELARFQALQGESGYHTDVIFREEGAMGDTVGAVAIDQAGNIAAATTTGGTRQKMPGRVGDSPLVGSGAYADNETAGVSATGHGESLMKLVISKLVCDLVAAGQSAQAAGDAAIARLASRLDGKGGLIVVDHSGRVGVAFNTDAMPHAIAAGNEPIRSGS